jgi:O-antigen ligase
MDAAVPLIALALLASVALVAPGPRLRSAAMLAALAIAPVVLVTHISGSAQFQALVGRPAIAAGAAAAALIGVAALAWLVARRPAVLPVLVVATLPFRVPIAVGGATANLLVPLYAVVAAGVLAYAVPRLTGRREDDPGRRPGSLEWALAAVLTLYAVQASWSIDVDHALENVVFFHVPFALAFVLVSRVPWTPALTRACLIVLVALAVAFTGIGFVEYTTRHLLLNPKVIASNQLQDYFRVNSLFFDPNIYGRFLALVMLLVVAWLLWARRAREVAAGALLLAVLWGGLVLTLSQSSFASLLVGLMVLGGMRWGTRRAVALAVAVLALGAAFILLAPGALRLDLGNSKSADAATSGRYDLISGGLRLFAERPIAGWGSGSFARQYRRSEHVSAQRATSASHTIPITVAAEQGIVGLAAYLALLACALARLLHRASSSPARAAVAAAFVALLAHTMMYAAFLEDPMTWTLLAVGTALAALPPRALGREAASPAPSAPAPAATAA